MSMRDFLFNRFRASDLHDGVVKTIPPNYAGLGSYEEYGLYGRYWPRTESQPTLMGYPPQYPRYNRLFAGYFRGRTTPAGQFQGYLVQVKDYGEPMIYPSMSVASLKGV